MTTASLPPPLFSHTASVSESERMSFTLFMSIVVHLVLILGIGFTAIQNDAIPPTLEITLSQHMSMETPKDADYLAQHNQQASGTLETQKQLTSDMRAEFADQNINRVEPMPTIQTTTLEQQQEKQVVSTTKEQKEKSITQTEDLSPEEAKLIKQQKKTVVDYSAELASLQAKLDRQKQRFAKRPRVKTLTSVAAKSAVDAEYLYRWQEKIEMLGNLNYPEEARRKKLYGNLRLLATIRPDGSVAKIELLKSSGHVVLDQSALRIVRMAAPFPPFPDELRKDIDRLEIIRTWRFEQGNILSTE